MRLAHALHCCMMAGATPVGACAAVCGSHSLEVITLLLALKARIAARTSSHPSPLSPPFLPPHAYLVPLTRRGWPRRGRGAHPAGGSPIACPTARSLVRNAAQSVRSPQRMPACIKAVTGVGAAAHRCFIRRTSSWFEATTRIEPSTSCKPRATSAPGLGLTATGKHTRAPCPWPHNLLAPD